MLFEVLPQLFGDEGNKGMKKPQRGLKHKGGDLQCLRSAKAVITGNIVLFQFKIPIAELVPEEMIQGIARLVNEEPLQISTTEHPSYTPDTFIYLQISVSIIIFNNIYRYQQI